MNWVASLGIAVVVAWSIATCQADNSSFAEAMYFGTADVQIKAAIADGVSVTAKRFPCANCHGRGGEGAREGTVIAPSLAFSTLSKANSERPAFTSETFHQFLSKGIKHNRERSAVGMPIYDVTQKQSAALLSYLKMIEEFESQGIFSDQLVFGYYSDTPGSMDAQSGFLEMQTLFNSINSRNTIFGRKLVARLIPGQVQSHDLAPVLAYLGSSNSSNVRSPLHPPILHPVFGAREQNGTVRLATNEPLLEEQMRKIFERMRADGVVSCSIINGTSPFSKQLTDAAWKVHAGLVADRKVPCTTYSGPAGSTTKPTGQHALFFLTGQSVQVASVIADRLSRQDMVYGQLDVILPALPALLKSGLPIILLDVHDNITRQSVATGKSFAVQNMLEATQLLERALEKSGRSITRERFLKAYTLEMQQAVKETFMTFVKFND